MVVKEPFVCAASDDGRVWGLRALSDGHAEVLRLGRGELELIRDAFGTEAVLLRNGKALVDPDSLDLSSCTVCMFLDSGAGHTSRRAGCATRVFGMRGHSLLQAVDRFSEAAGFLIKDKS